MGIHSINKVVDKKLGCYTFRNISEYKGYKIAVDVIGYMYMYKSISKTMWMDMMIRMFSCLEKAGCTAIYVFDGKPPPEKSAEKARRKKELDLKQEKNKSLHDDYLHYVNTKEVRESIKPYIKTSILHPDVFDISELEKKMEKMDNQAVYIDHSDLDKIKTCMNLLGIHYLDADDEAERICAWMCASGKVDAVLSNDTDIIAYGIKMWISDLNVSSGECYELTTENLLKRLSEYSKKEWTSDMVRDLCIMCGTDYNSNIPMIGPEKSVAFLAEHRTIEAIPIDESKKQLLNHVNVRKLFTPKVDFDSGELEHIGIDISATKEFLTEINSRVNFDELCRLFHKIEF